MGLALVSNMQQSPALPMIFHLWCELVQAVTSILGPTSKGCTSAGQLRATQLYSCSFSLRVWPSILMLTSLWPATFSSSLASLCCVAWTPRCGSSRDSQACSAACRHEMATKLRGSTFSSRVCPEVRMMTSS